MFASSDIDTHKQIAVFNNTLPGVDTKIAEGIKTRLSADGYNADLLSIKDIAERNKFNSEKYFILIIPEAHTFPADLLASVTTYISNGGHLMTLNGPFMENLCWITKTGKYVNKNEINILRNQKPTEIMLYDFESEQIGKFNKFKRETDNVSSTNTVKIVNDNAANSTKNSLFIEVSNLNNWDTYRMELNTKLNSDKVILTFWAKGDERTKDLVLELNEVDGSRWITTVKLSTEWQRYSVHVNTFYL